ncbi:AsmA family protein [Cognatishimia maritima]|uniref:AsmA protein n=1 Tax=Cognatishimia maritima TaxID=870908 RepID=A0A1M5KM12_9RHOB|nr:AsmA family protein [Cognatishimia maritima]SHG53818.1 AsmA protein [Cognatishimia maritima]
MRLLKVLLSVVVVLFVTLVGLIFVLPGEKIANLAADQVKAQTGRDLVFDGDVTFSFFPTLGVDTGAVALGNADWSENGPMFQAQSARVGLDMMALLGGGIQIKHIELDSPTILLETDSENHANWDLFPPGESAEATDGDNAATDAVAGFTLEKLTVTDASIRYRENGQERLALSAVSAALDWGGEGAEITVTATPVSDPVSLVASVGDLDGLMAGDVTSVIAKIEAAGNSVSFDGRASIVPELQGFAALDLPKPDRFLAALGIPSQGTPATEFSGDITLTKEMLFSLRNAKVAALGNAVDLDADVDLSGKPVVTANLRAGTINLEALTGTDAGAADDAGSSEWSKAPIDVSALGLFDGTIAISANAIETGTLSFGASRLSVEVDNARAVATLQQLSGYDGEITGQFVANNRSGLSVGGKLNVSGMELKGLLTDFAEVDRFTGKADAQIGFLAAGQSLHAIMNSLQGDGLVSVGTGTISGIDLDKLFRGTPTGGTTVFDNMVATWTIADGVLKNEDLLMDLPKVQAKGAGAVGLGAQTIDYTFTPQIKNATDTGLAIPVRVKGPWAGPKIWPDLEAVANQNLKEERKELREKAKQTVADKLGVKAEEGQSLEDAAKKKLEEEAAKQLLKLLGKN